jgi:CHAD domain-containing protein
VAPGAAPRPPAAGATTILLPPAPPLAADGPGSPAAHAAKVPLHKRAAGLESTDSMAAAARKVLRVQFEALKAQEDGTRAGEDPTATHRMRTATRRMRTALQAADPYLHSDIARQVRRGLRDLSRALGPVRDLDVLLGHAYAFQATLPDEQHADLAGLLSDWTDQRKRARKVLCRLLDSKDFKRFKQAVHTFLEAGDSPPDDADGASPVQIRHVIGGSLWHRYEAVRAYETIMPGATVLQLHALRTTGKYLRYSLELFREVLPAEATALAADVVAMQDRLGTMHDADVAAGLIHAYISRTVRERSKKRAADPAPGLAAYLADREAAVAAVHTSLGPTWSQVSGPTWRARLAAVIAAV